ncbi:MAG: peptidyl-prolyl cis-trans isomerase [Gemmatimonadota bacterium]|nr:peptidyl-prolyl cis-trans isomerase [Gemmatimonadota bacterium]
MLQTMRSWAKYIWIFVIAAPFIIGFLLYQTSGLGTAATVTPSTAVAKVDGQEILYSQYEQAVQNQINSEQQQSSRSLTQDEQRQIENSVFDQMVLQILLDREYKRRHITVTASEIREYAKYAPPQWIQQLPDLQTDGKFDMAKYQRLLASPSAREGGFLVQLEQYYRQEIPKQKLYEQVTAGVYVSDAELWREYQDAHDSATVTYVAWTNQPDSADLKSVTTAEMQAYYDAHHAEFDQPGTARLALVTIPRLVTAADSAAVLAHARALRDSIVSGKVSFADAAKIESVDTASANNGGLLGMSAKGRFVPAFDKAAWALKPGEISEPVLTSFGYHLIKVDSRKGDSIAVRHILLPIQPTDSNQARIDREADQLANMAANAEAPAKFDSAAAKLHLTIFKITTNENQPAVLGSGQQVPSVSAWAFGGARPGDVSDLYSDDNGYYMARLDTLMPSGLRPFAEVQDRIRYEIAARHHLDRMMPAATTFAHDAAAAGMDAAAKTTGLHLDKTAVMFTRTSFIPGLGGQYTRAIGAAFGLPVNAVSQPIRDEAQITVERVDRRVQADSVAWVKQKDVQKAQRIQQLQQARIQMFLQDLHDAAKIDDRRKQIDAANRHASS